MYFIRYIQSRTALIFRTLCTWLYEVVAPGSPLNDFFINRKIPKATATKTQDSAERNLAELVKPGEWRQV